GRFAVGSSPRRVVDVLFFFSSRRRHTRWPRDWSSDVCSSDLLAQPFEGHAAFMYVERLRELLQKGVTLSTAEHQIRASSVFTTHTPVPAGHDVFTTEQVEQVTGPFWNTMGIARDQFMGLGNTGPTDPR